MSLNAQHKDALKKLTKQIQLLKRKEKTTKQKLRAALANARKMAKVYQNKLEKKNKDTRLKIAAAEAAVYAKLAKTISKKTSLVKKNSKKIKKIASSIAAKTRKKN